MNVLHWRGIIADQNTLQRRMAFVASVVTSAALTCMQLGFVPLSPSGELSLYLILMLAPVVVASLLLGTLAGTMLGVWAGLTLFVHAQVMPLDFRELLYVTPFTSFVMYGALGLVMGVLFSLVVPRTRSRKSAIISIVCACAAVSLVGGMQFSLLPFYEPTASELLLQAALNTVVMALPCAIAYLVVAWASGAVRNMGVRQAFSVSILVGMVLAYLVVASESFVTATVNELREAEASMQGAAFYLCNQLDEAERRDAALMTLAEAAIPELGESKVLEHIEATEPYGSVMDGYTAEQEGIVVAAKDDLVLISNDDRITTGVSLDALFDEDTVQAIRTSAQTGEMQHFVYSGVLTSPSNMWEFAQGIQMGYLCAMQRDTGLVVVIRPSSMVFKDRLDLVGREVVMAIALLFAVYLIVTKLLDNMVARRIEKTDEVLGHICAGKLDERCEVVGTIEFRALATGINSTVDELNRLIGEAEQRMEDDLAAGRAIQEGSLPRRFPAFPKVEAVDLFASMNAAKEVGGDFYDFFEVDDHTVAFLIADVSGKGIPGALFMMAAKAEIQNYLSTGMGVEQALVAADSYLCAHNKASMFVTVWAATLDWKSGLLTYVNAGHNYPLLRHGKGGKWVWLKGTGDRFLGWFNMQKFDERTIQLEPGDELLLYTDGVNEAFNVLGEEYGNDRLEKFLCAHADERPRPLVEGLRASVAEWAQGAEQSDDITILAMEYKAGPEK